MAQIYDHPILLTIKKTKTLQNFLLTAVTDKANCATKGSVSKVILRMLVAGIAVQVPFNKENPFSSQNATFKMWV